MAAEVDHGRLELAHLAEEIERLGRPAGLEDEPIAMAAPPQLGVDRVSLAVERQATGVRRVGCHEQDHVLLRSRTSRRWLLHALPQ
jgi:hypothetical protein